MIYFVDWLDDVELVGIISGSKGYRGIVRWITIYTLSTRTVGLCRPAGVSCTP